jgi:hypothetical protein
MFRSLELIINTIQYNKNKTLSVGSI